MNLKILALTALIPLSLSTAHAFDMGEFKDRMTDELKKYPQYEKAVEKAEELTNKAVELSNKGINSTKDYFELLADDYSEKYERAQGNPMPTKTGLKLYDLGAYNVLLDCADRTASIVFYDEKIDTGNFKRKDRFYKAKAIPDECEPKSTGTYKWSGKPTYDRGHLAMANVFDYSETAMKQANYMVNVVPQISSINRQGSWREVEKRMECMRTPTFIGNGKTLTTIAGVVWGNDPTDDHFLKSHGQKTPSQLFKIVVHRTPSGNKTYAWVFPNDHEEVGNVNVDDLLVSPRYIEQITGYRELRDLVPADNYEVIANKTPNMMYGCDLS